MTNGHQDLLGRAVQLHQSGHVREALDLYNQLLPSEPDNPELLCLLGIASLQTGQMKRGAELVQRALAINPGNLVARNNIGLAVQAFQRLDQALSGHKGSAINPDYADAYHNWGLALQQLGRLEDALAGYDHALAIKPDFADAYHNRGNLLQGLSRPNDALASYDKALAIRPVSAGTYHNRGVALQQLGRLDDALASYDHALAINPAYAAAHHSRGVTLHKRKRLDEALASYDKALAIDPDYADAYCSRGVALQELKRVPASLVILDGRSIKIVFDEIGGTYDGTMNEDGTIVAGIWTQRNGPQVFNLQKAIPAIEWKDPSPHKVRFVTVAKDVELEVLDWGGTGRPLVLLAGLGNTAHVFDKFAPKLTANYHVYGITRRGFGASSKPPPIEENYNADRLGDDVLAVIATLKLDHPVLAGHSVAGEELSSIGTRHPERVSGLIYLDAAQPYTFLEIKKNMQGLNAQRLASIESAPPKTPPPSSPPLPPALTARDAIMRGTRDYTGIKPPFLAVVPVPHQCQPNCNTEFAKDDAARMTALADTLEADYPNAHVVRLPNANHYVFFSNEADVLREMSAFIDGLPMP